MTLKEFYNGLKREDPPKTTFIERVATRCGVSPETVRWWVKGMTRPSNKDHYRIISEVTRDFDPTLGEGFFIPENELFPDAE